MLVDDNARVRAALGSLLRVFHFEIAGEAADGHAALAEATRLAPDVVLLDVTMPLLGGLKVLPGMRDRLPLGVIIVLTSHESPVYRDEALRLGADAFLPKWQAPFDLIPAIQSALSALQTRARRQA